VTSFAYTTYGNRAAVVVHASSSSVSGRSRSPVLEYFLIKCETVGCPDFTPANAHVWTQRFGTRMQLGCVTSSVTWQMFCVDGQWQGPSNNCTPSGRTTTSRSLTGFRSRHKELLLAFKYRKHALLSAPIASDELVPLWKYELTNSQNCCLVA